MKKLIAMLLAIALLVMASGCAGGNTEPTEKETLPQQTGTAAATDGETLPYATEPTEKETLPQQTGTAAATDGETLPYATEPAIVETQPQDTEPVAPIKVTVYLVDRSDIFDSGYQVYNYDEDYNILSIETFSIEDTLLYKTHFNKQDANGMFCEYAEEWDGDSQYHSFVWSADGKLQEEQYNPGFSGDQYEYDSAGNMTQMRNYYDGILDYTVYFEYDGSALQRAYCENKEGYKLFECKIESGRIVEKECLDAEGTAYCSYTYKYNKNGNLEQIRFVMDGEDSPAETFTYRAVEVDASRAPYLIAQQQYLLDISHAG